MNLSNRIGDFTSNYFLYRSMIIPIITAKVVATTTKTTNEGDINFKTDLFKYNQL